MSPRNKKPPMLWGCALGASLLLGCTALSPVGAAESPLCDRDHPTVFGCAVSGGKAVALCGKPPQWLQYRFGTAARVELAFPKDAEHGARELRYAEYFRLDTQRTEVSFEIGGYRYSLFDGAEHDQRSAGVSVEATQTGGRSAEWRCTGPIHGDLQQLKSMLPCDADSALQMGACPPP